MHTISLLELNYLFINMRSSGYFFNGNVFTTKEITFHFRRGNAPNQRPKRQKFGRARGLVSLYST